MRERFTEASMPIWALVSGFAGEERRQRRLLMLQAYIDDSGSGRNGPNLVLGGHIATVEQWAAFSDEWDEHLRHANMPYFKMSEAVSSGPGVEITASFYRIIERHNLEGLSVLVPQDGLATLVRKLGLPDFFEDPYVIAFRTLVSGLPEIQAAHVPAGAPAKPVDFVFDEQTQSERVLAAWPHFRVSPEAKRFVGRMPLFRKDIEAKPLQAADLYAWWVRHWRNAGISVDQGRFPWEMKKQLPRLHIEYDYHGLEAHLRDLVPAYLRSISTGEPLTVTFNDGVVQRTR